jgi:hypothetical protein
MASKGAHEHLTEHVLQQLGFSERSIEIAKSGNVAVDITPGNQGSSADVANLHAMRGFAGGRMQTELEARNAVFALLDREASAIVQSIRDEDFEAALTQLGAALHTVQDREFHAFGEWRYDSIAGAIASNAPSMLVHGSRDLLDRRLQVGFELFQSERSAGRAGADPAAFGTGNGFVMSTMFVQDVRGAPVGLGIQAGCDAGRGQGAEWRGMLTLRIGGGALSPGTTGMSQPAPQAAGESFRLDLPHRVHGSAERECRVFVERVRTQVESNWDAFLAYGR